MSMAGPRSQIFRDYSVPVVPPRYLSYMNVEHQYLATFRLNFIRLSTHTLKFRTSVGADCMHITERMRFDCHNQKLYRWVSMSVAADSRKSFSSFQRY
jgi:hypothetical protein